MSKEHVKKNLRTLNELENQVEKLKKKANEIRGKDLINFLQLEDGEDVDVFFVEDKHGYTFFPYSVHYKLPGRKSFIFLF